MICSIPIAVNGSLSGRQHCDIVTFEGQFDDLAQRDAWRQRIKGVFRQTSFGGHVLRGDERLDPVVEYVLNNPMRTVLVERWCDYRVSGVERVRARGRRRGTSPRPTAKIRYTYALWGGATELTPSPSESLAEGEGWGEGGRSLAHNPGEPAPWSLVQSLAPAEWT